MDEHSTSDMIARFEDVDMEIIDHDGERWVTVKQLSDALGYEDHRALIRLIDRHPGEFAGKTVVVKLTTSHINSPGDTIINYHGVIRAGMLSDAPRAPRFRDWAERVLYAVMTTGSYAVPDLAAATDDRHWTERLTGDARFRLQELRMQTRQIIKQAPTDPMAWWLMAEMVSDSDPLAQWLREKVSVLTGRSKSKPPALFTEETVAESGIEPYATRKIRPKLDGDPTVKEYLSRLLCENKLPQDDMLAMCRGYFGADRTPPKTALSRLKRQLEAEGRLGWWLSAQEGNPDLTRH